MKVTEVTVVAKYSLDTGHGWKSIEVGAAATLTGSNETLEAAQQELYRRLSRQLKVLWANGSKADAPEGHQTDAQASANESHIQAPTKCSSVPVEHFCTEHNQEFRAREGKFGTFFSHKAPDGSWHNEAKK